MSLDMTFERSVSAQWHGITDIVEQVRALFTIRRDAPSPAGVFVSRVSGMLDTIDTGLAQIHVLTAENERLTDALTEMVARGIDGAAERLASITDIRAQLPDQERLLLVARAQAMDLMVQINPEDAWVYEREHLVSFRRAIADADAGRTTVYESDEEFFAGLDRIYADANS